MLGRFWKHLGFLFPFVMSLVLVIAVACGGSDEPAAKSQPAATSAAAVTAPATEAPHPLPRWHRESSQRRHQNQ